MCKLTNYVRNCVVFWKIYTADKNFTRPPVATVATNSKSGLTFPLLKDKFLGTKLLPDRTEVTFIQKH